MISYSLRPAGAADLPLFARWLKTPEVVRWWGDPDEQLALIAEDLDVSEMMQWVISNQNRPFAYAQAYEVHVWPQAQFEHLPPGAMAIDAFIGEPEMVGRGHGAAFLRLLAMGLKAGGAPVVAVDPHCGNYRARRAYEKAGFRGDGVFETSEGSLVVMTFLDGSNGVESVPLRR